MQSSGSGPAFRLPSWPWRLGRAIALALVIVLAAWLVLVPGETGYPVRSEVSEGASLAEGARTAVDDYYARHHVYPVDNRQADLPSPTSIHGTYVIGVAIDRGRVTATFGNKSDDAIAGRALVFVPRVEAGSRRWDCNSTAGTTVPVKYRPSRCRP